MLGVPRSISTLFSPNWTSSLALRISNIRLSSSEVATREEQADEFIHEEEAKAAELEAKRNKSRLRTHHFNQLHQRLSVDVSNPVHCFHQSIKFQQKLAARYGASSGVDLGIAWPTQEALNEIIEYEKVAYPFTLQEMVDKKKQEREERKNKLVAREKEIDLKVSKLAQWMKELEDRKAKKLAAAKLAQEKKDRLIEEVRLHFGYVVNMKDPRFQEMLEQKEKEQRKAEKEMKKKAKFEKVTEKAKALAESLEKQVSHKKTPES